MDMWNINRGGIMNNLLCKLFGHKWSIFIKTGTRVGHRDILSGFGDTTTEEFIEPIGHTYEYKYCKRCGIKNPNYEE